MDKNINEGEKLAFDSIKAFPDQCEQAWNDIKSLKNPGDSYKGIENLVVCGMGGSRFTPLSIKECFSDKIKVPYEIIDGYVLPAYVNNKTLVILSSYSGTTEEVLACAKEALRRKSMIAAVSKGGDVSDFCRKNNLFSYIFNERFNPSNQPRLGVGYMLFGHLGLLYKLNLINVEESEIIESISDLKKLNLELKAKELSEYMKGKEVFVVTSEHLKGFANGFANQINENAKTVSSYRYISELNHHLMEGLGNPADLKDRWLFILIKSSLYSERIKARYPITKDIIEKQKVKTYEYQLSGKSKLSDLLEGFALSALSTFYLAKYYNIDPTKIPWVDYFKEQLSKLSS